MWLSPASFNDLQVFLGFITSIDKASYFQLPEIFSYIYPDDNTTQGSGSYSTVKTEPPSLTPPYTPPDMMEGVHDDPDELDQFLPMPNIETSLASGFSMSSADELVEQKHVLPMQTNAQTPETNVCDSNFIASQMLQTMISQSQQKGILQQQPGNSAANDVSLVDILQRPRNPNPVTSVQSGTVPQNAQLVRYLNNTRLGVLHLFDLDKTCFLCLKFHWTIFMHWPCYPPVYTQVYLS